MKRLTIITVCYNSINCIEKCIKSILPQLNESIEYLIIDGKSNDGTLDIIEKYSKQNKNIIYISEKDSGIYNAMNKGLNMANGEWIIYINSDDCLVPNVVERVLPYLVDDYDCIYGDTYNVLSYEENKYLKKVEAYQDLKKLDRQMIACHQSIFIKKSVMQQVGGFNEKYKIAADWDLLLKIRNNNFKFKYVPIVISEFSMGGISSNTNYIHETHSIRKSNKCYKLLDIYSVLEFIHGLHIKMKLYKILYGKKAFDKWLKNNDYEKLGEK